MVTQPHHRVVGIVEGDDEGAARSQYARYFCETDGDLSAYLENDPAKTPDRTRLDCLPTSEGGLCRIADY